MPSKEWGKYVLSQALRHPNEDAELRAEERLGMAKDKEARAIQKHALDLELEAERIRDTRLQAARNVLKTLEDAQKRKEHEETIQQAAMVRFELLHIKPNDPDFDAKMSAIIVNFPHGMQDTGAKGQFAAAQFAAARAQAELKKYRDQDIEPRDFQKIVNGEFVGYDMTKMNAALLQKITEESEAKIRAAKKISVESGVKVHTSTGIGSLTVTPSPDEEFIRQLGIKQSHLNTVLGNAIAHGAKDAPKQSKAAGNETEAAFVKLATQAGDANIPSEWYAKVRAYRQAMTEHQRENIKADMNVDAQIQHATILEAEGRAKESQYKTKRQKDRDVIGDVYLQYKTAKGAFTKEKEAAELYNNFNELLKKYRKDHPDDSSWNPIHWGEGEPPPVDKSPFPGSVNPKAPAVKKVTDQAVDSASGAPGDDKIKSAAASTGIPPELNDAAKEFKMHYMPSAKGEDYATWRSKELVDGYPGEHTPETALEQATSEQQQAEDDLDSLASMHGVDPEQLSIFKGNIANGTDADLTPQEDGTWITEPKSSASQAASPYPS